MPHRTPQEDDDPCRSAAQARLRYVSDAQPGIRRVRRGRGFAYYDAAGRLLRSALIRHRIEALAIPPAWRDIWICSDPQGHLQATGRDERGRKQYRYHPRWHSVRDAQKFAHLDTFGGMLPRLRRRVTADLSRPGLPKAKVLALVVRLLDRAHLRVGDESYVRSNHSYGVTTLRNRHARVLNGEVQLRFRAKSGQLRKVTIDDARLARLVRRCRELPGQRLFEYLDQAGEVRAIDSTEVNAWLEAISGEAITSKEFRTWAGSLVALRHLLAVPAPAAKAEAERNVRAAIESAAGELGNTVAVCRRCYVHPQVVERYLADPTAFLRQANTVERKSIAGLRAGETFLLRLVKDGAKAVKNGISH